MAYFLSFTKIRHSSGFGTLVIFYSISGASASIYLIYFLDSLDFRESFPNFVKFLSLMQAIPPIGVISGLGKILQISEIVHVCPSTRRVFQKIVDQSFASPHLSFIEEYCLNNSEPKYLEIISPELISLILSGLIFYVWTLILSLSFHKISKCISSTMNKIAHPISVSETIPDEDVVNEKNYVDQLCSSDELSGQAFLVHRVIKDFFNWRLFRFRAVHDVSFSVREKECFGLLGINGAGKTTTFSMLTGDIPMTNGDAFIGRSNISKNLVDYQKNVSYCPQENALLDLLTPEETLILFARLRGR